MWNQEINNNGRLQAQVVEDEPSHEIYANLIGLNNPNKLFHPPQQEHQAHAQHLHKNSDGGINANENGDCASGNLIPAETSNQAEVRNSSRGKVSIYRKRLAEGCSLSKLSIDQTNKGFQMLKQMGWKESEGGLGKERQGTLTPVKTSLKRDKKGIGSGERLMAKVTHGTNTRSSGAGAAGRGQSNQETKAARRLRMQMEAQKDQERNKRARLLITSDLPEEYLAYL